MSKLKRVQIVRTQTVGCPACGHETVLRDPVDNVDVRMEYAPPYFEMWIHRVCGTCGQHLEINVLTATCDIRVTEKSNGAVK